MAYLADILHNWRRYGFSMKIPYMGACDFRMSDGTVVCRYDDDDAIPDTTWTVRDGVLTTCGLHLLEGMLNSVLVGMKPLDVPVPELMKLWGSGVEGTSLSYEGFVVAEVVDGELITFEGDSLHCQADLNRLLRRCDRMSLEDIERKCGKGQSDTPTQVGKQDKEPPMSDALLVEIQEEWCAFDEECSIYVTQTDEGVDECVLFLHEGEEIDEWWLVGDELEPLSGDEGRSLADIQSHLRQWMQNLRQGKANAEARSWVSKMRRAFEVKEQEYLLAKHALKLAEDVLAANPYDDPDEDVGEV